MYAGMWQLAKRILPNTALERILFPSKSELLQFFEMDHLLVGEWYRFCFQVVLIFLIEHGGTVEYTYTPANPIIEKYCRTIPLSITTAYPSPLSSPALSRSSSIESLDEAFQTAAATPATRPTTPIIGGGVLPRRPSGLSMTAFNPPLSITPRSPQEAAMGLWRTASTSSLSGLRRIPSISDFTLHLAETHAAIASDSSGEDENEEEMKERERAAKEYARSMSEAASRQQQNVLRLQEEEEEMLSTASSSRFSSRATSRNQSRAASREASPSRRRDDISGTFASRAVKFSGSDHVVSFSLFLFITLLIQFSVTL